MRPFFTLVILSGSLLVLAAGATAASADYTITNRMEILGTVDLGAINNGYQTVNLASQSATTSTIDVTYHPYFQPPVLQPDMNWQVNDQTDALAPYLQSGLTANWDQPFRQQVLADLLAAGIDPSKLSDVDTVKQVSSWLVKNFSGKGPFVPYFVEFQNGQPVVPDATRAAFDHEKTDNGITSDEDAFDKGLFGKGIYQNRSASSCTPSAILWTTVFRALGIPTRIIVNVPAVDANDRSQILNAELGIHDPSTQRTVFFGFSNISVNGPNWASHSFNEVYVGGRWTRLNYNTLDQPIVDEYYFGLLTEVKQMADWSDSGLVETWGFRGAEAEVTEPRNLVPELSSQNPYRSLGISDSEGGSPAAPAPPAPKVQLTATPVQGWLPSSPTVPAWLKPNLVSEAGLTQVVLSISEVIQGNDFIPMKVFPMYASPHLILKIPGQPDVVGSEFGSYYDGSTDPHGYIVNFPVDLSQLPSGTALQIATPADNDPSFSWVLPVPLTILVP